MSTKEIITAASDPTFYTRVSFISLKVAQQVASEPEDHPNHKNRVAYSNRIFMGADNALLLSNHVAASNPTIAAALETSGGDAVPDEDIEFALASIWDARATAFEPPPVLIQAAPVGDVMPMDIAPPIEPAEFELPKGDPALAGKRK